MGTKKTVFVKIHELKTVYVKDKCTCYQYEYREANYTFFGLIRSSKTGWYKHDCFETFYIGKLGSSVFDNYIVENNVVYEKPYVTINLKDAYYIKKFETYEDALQYAKMIMDSKDDLIIEF